MYYHSTNLQNLITTKIFDAVRAVVLKLFEIAYHLVFFLMLECTPLVSEERNLLKMYLRLI